MTVDPARLRSINGRDRNSSGEYVLYWMIAARRPHWNHGLDHAASVASEFDVPLVVMEALRLGYPWASQRLHQFVVEGMAANRAAFRDTPVRYFPYLEPIEGAGRGLLEEVAARAVAVVTDDYPTFFLPAMVAAAGHRLTVSLEAVDSNGVMPMRAVPKSFARAHDFRRHLQGSLSDHIDDVPAAQPPHHLVGAGAGLLDDISATWSPVDLDLPVPKLVADLEFAASVPPVADRGGFVEGGRRLTGFVDGRLDRYLERNHPDDDPSSGLSPYLHFGHVGSHQVLAAVAAREDWHPGRIGTRRDGGREGWWGMSPRAEAFLDQLVTWRELGFNMCVFDPHHARYDSLPGWALRTLADHAGDPREHVYSVGEFERAITHDEVWNAAQRQLVTEGRIHNYLRMLWGKKILEWTESPRRALEIMIHLNNTFALDGRDPNSYSGIMWILGKFDRAWGPERPVFGKVRYMSSENTKRKLRLNAYMAKYGEQQSLFE